MGILESCKGRSFRRTHPVSDHSSSSQQLIAPEISTERPKDGNLPALSDPSSSSLNSQQLIAPESPKESPKDENLPALSDPSSSSLNSQQLIAPESPKESPKDENLPALSDPSSSSLNSQQLIAPEISKENPKDENLPAISPTKKEAIVSHGIKNKAYHVLGRKTANFRKLYVLGRELRRELRGSTYLCMEIATEIKYACKFISKKKLNSEEEVEDVRREIHVLHHLAGYKNIVTIKAAYEDPLYVYIVMELCEGGEFFEQINQSRRFSEREAAELTKIIVGVVQDCHSLGVMHRDLKPENFLLLDKDDDFSLKAVDFGLAVFFEPGQVFTDMAGSPHYMAPEVIHRRYGPEAEVWAAGVILYKLLSGVPPFWAETEQGVFDAVLKGHIDFESDPWPLISGSAKDLIRKMLCSWPSERLTAHDVLCHPWICQNGVSPDRAPDPAVLSRLKQFSAMNKLKKMALRVIAEKLSEEELAGLREMFKVMDTDNNGKITYYELKAGLQRYGSVLKDTEIRGLMDAADVDYSGAIDYGEFIAATMHLKKLEREENLIAAFQYFDKDGSGYITVDELQQACTEHNMTVVYLEHIEDIIRDVDQDNDGMINYGEFVALMQKGNVEIGRQNMQKRLILGSSWRSWLLQR